MSLPRLPCLSSNLIKQALLHENIPALRPIRRKRSNIQKAHLSTSKPRKQETYAQRYGTAAEPHPPPPASSMPENPQEKKSLAGAIEKEVKLSPKPEEQKKVEAPPPPPPPNKEASKPPADIVTEEPDRSRDGAIDATLKDPSTRAAELNTAESHTKETADAIIAARSIENARKSEPLETVLRMGPPTTEKPEEHRAPHLHAPPYVHHFDTYTLVKDLQRGGFSEDHSVTIMKAIRGLLAINLDVAKEGLVSKSDVENETYLFRAACSELRTEILNTRKSSITKTRTQLSHLQHTTDILSQRTSQETLALRDDLRGMLNDRRMEVRAQAQSRESEISQLNNMISVRLNSDSKSEVEGLRWVLTRRAAMAIGVMALLILGSLRYSSWMLREREMRMKEEGAAGEKMGGVGVGYTTPSREIGTQTGAMGVGAVEKAENAGYVSLG